MSQGVWSELSTTRLLLLSCRYFFLVLTKAPSQTVQTVHMEGVVNFCLSSVGRNRFLQPPTGLFGGDDWGLGTYKATDDHYNRSEAYLRTITQRLDQTNAPLYHTRPPLLSVVSACYQRIPCRAGTPWVRPWYNRPPRRTPLCYA